MNGPEDEMSSSRGTVGAVAIGRNEGERLRRCLASMEGKFDRVVYVDSGSTDDSLEIAKAANVEIVNLDLSIPFTAARARNAGFAQLAANCGLPEFVQFVDGDCALQPEWIDQARAAIEDDPSLGLVTGWRSEIYRDRSIYNALCDFEWRRPAGEIMTCGGDMLVRSAAFKAIGGFSDVVIAAEDDEFCVRLRQAGWRLMRLPIEMTRHDAAILHFSQWWQRAVRSGHGFAQVGALHPEYFGRERFRVMLFGAVLPTIAAFGVVLALLAGTAWALLPLMVLGIYGLSYMRTVQGLWRNGLPIVEALAHGVFLSLSKFPNFVGIFTYWWRQFHGRKMEIIEYK